MKMWLDDSRCDERWHSLERDTKGHYHVYHADGRECAECEFRVGEDKE